MKNIIYGPVYVTFYNCPIFLGLNSIVEDLCLFYMDRNQLIRRIFKSDSCAKFFRFIENNPSKHCRQFKTEMENNSVIRNPNFYGFGAWESPV